MKQNLLKFIVLSVTLLLVSTLLPKNSYAACSIALDKESIGEDFKGKLKVTGAGCFIEGKQYLMKAAAGDNENQYDSDWKKAKGTDEVTFDLNVFAGNLGSDHKGTWNVYICFQDGTDKNASKCKDGASGSTYLIGKVPLKVGGDDIPNDGTPLPKLDPAVQTACKFQIQSEVTLKVTGLVDGKAYEWWEDGTDHKGDINLTSGQTDTNFTIPKEEGAFDTPGEKTVCVDVKDRKTKSFDNCILLKFEPVQPDDTKCDEAPSFPIKYPPCAAEIGPAGCTKVNTAIGLLATNPDTFISTIFAIFLGLSGGIALLLIIRSGYQLLTSQGNAEKVKEAQDRITSAIVGLLFALFSLVILESIGIDILHLPGLGR